MIIYIDDKDIGKTISYTKKEGVKQYLYAHDKEGFIIKDLKAYRKYVVARTCKACQDEIARQTFQSGKLSAGVIEKALKKVIKENL